MSLGQKAVRGAAWTILSSVGSRIIALVGTMIMTHFLSPEEAGPVYVAFPMVMTAHFISVVGFGHYIVTKRDVGPEGVFHASFYHLTMGCAALGAVWLFRRPLMAAFGTPEAVAFVPGLVVAVALERIGQMPERLLVRDLRMRVVAMSRTAGELSFTFVSIFLAAQGYGAQSLVIGNIVRSAIYLAVNFSAVGFREWAQPVRLTWERTRDLFRFGAPIYLAGLAYFGSRRWDNLLFARLFGPAQLSLYNQAYNLADVPATHVGEHIGDVLLPSFAQMEPERRKDALVRSTALLCLIMFPLAVGLGVVGPTAVRALLAEEWWEAGPMVMILAALSIVRPIHWTIAAYLAARGKGRTLLFLDLPHLGVLFLCMWIFGQAGPLWACVGVGVAFAILAFAAIFAVQLVDDVPAGQMLAKLVPPLVACGPMVGAVLAARRGLEWLGVGAGKVSLVVEVVVGGLVFVPSALLLAPGVSREFLRLVRESILKRRS